MPHAVHAFQTFEEQQPTLQQCIARWVAVRQVGCLQNLHEHIALLPAVLVRQVARHTADPVPPPLLASERHVQVEGVDLRL